MKKIVVALIAVSNNPPKIVKRIAIFGSVAAPLFCLWYNPDFAANNIGVWALVVAVLLVLIYLDEGRA
ncbi:MAG: hypothetical protein AAAB35_21405 [Phyllobacterium sp.]|uniref:hypothetical protein n=1 Tax=Phyllobacterium sp. TaxID=1871046 RepID=UPI0030F30399